MPYSSGTFSLLYDWVAEQASSPIEIAKLKTQETDIATGLTNCVLRDGTGKTTTSFLPAVSTTLSLGSATFLWKDAFLSGVVYGADGTAALPSYSFANKPNLGISSPAADTLTFTTGGTAKVSIGTKMTFGTGFIIAGEDGSAAAPFYTFNASPGSGFYRIGANNIGLSLGGVKVFDIAAQVTTYSSSANAQILFGVTSTSSGTTAVAELGATNNSSHSAGLAITSSGWSGTWVTYGPTGEQASLNVFGNVPLVIGSNEKAAWIVTDGVPKLSSRYNSSPVYLYSAVKSADEIVNNSTTLQDDDHLFFTVDAAGRYRIELHLQCTAASNTPQIKFQLSYSGTMVEGYALGITLDSGGTVALSLLVPAAGFGTTQGFSNTNAITNVYTFQGAVEFSTGGVFKLQWAQNVANASNTTVKKNSYLRLIPLS